MLKVNHLKTVLCFLKKKSSAFCTFSFIHFFFCIELLDKCKQVGKDSVKLLTAWQTGIKIDECSESLKITVNDIESMASTTQANESLGDLVEDELGMMDRAIEEAAKRIQVCVSYQ